MFDTVWLSIPFKLTDSEMKRVFTKTNSTKPNADSGTTYFLPLVGKAEGDPHLTYVHNDETGRSYLKVQVSIPKFLRGSNVYEINEQDIRNFFILLRKVLSKKLKLPLNRIPRIEDWTVTKLDVCKNFHTGNQVQQYLRVLASVYIPKYQTHPIHAKGSADVETIYWEASRRRLKFYDKEAEMLKSKKSKKKHRRQAKGILRFEVTLLRTELRRLGIRKAEDILTSRFASKILQKELAKLGVTNLRPISGLTAAINKINRSNLSKQQKASLIAFISEQYFCGKGSRSARTIQRNRRLLKQIFGSSNIIISEVSLPPLEVSKNDQQ
ncbi:phage/plasmid replication protein [Paenibacillus cisolokensis]|uniref:phage/plasmid replication domain-containing protein n=1 Tax=Paenibacillus cisolokensis TaxID=1658519 RepID=UPI003D2D8D5D